MKTEQRGALTVKEEYATEEAREMIEEVLAYLRATTEYPFVAIAISHESDDHESAFVLHGEELGQYEYVERRTGFGGDCYWNCSREDTLQWLVEELIHRFGDAYHELEVELMDIAVARERLETRGETTLEHKSFEEVFGETDRTEYNRKRCFGSRSTIPRFARDLITEPFYDAVEAIEAAEEAHKEQFTPSA